MKKSKPIWIPITIAGVIFRIAALIFLVPFSIFLILSTIGRIENASIEKQLTEYVNTNYEELESQSRELLQEYRSMEVPGEYPYGFFETVRGNDVDGHYTAADDFDDSIKRITVCEDNNGHRYIQFNYASRGIVPSGTSYDFVYSPDDVPVSYWHFDEYALEKTGENEWEWDAGGDNGGSIKKIRDKFYLCKDWW